MEVAEIVCFHSELDIMIHNDGSIIKLYHLPRYAFDMMWGCFIKIDIKLSTQASDWGVVCWSDRVSSVIVS